MSSGGCGEFGESLLLMARGTNLACRLCRRPVSVDDLQSMQSSRVQKEILQSRVQTIATQALQEVVQHARTLHRENTTIHTCIQCICYLITTFSIRSSVTIVYIFSCENHRFVNYIHCVTCGKYSPLLFKWLMLKYRNLCSLEIAA